MLEIPSHPEHGLSLEALSLAAEQWPIKACVVIPTLSNPLGHCMPGENKQALVAWAEQRNIALIEDDIYGDFLVGGRRRRPLKSWDTSGIVYHCSSATKTVGAGLRIGWLVSQTLSRNEACYFQYLDTVSVQTAGQLVLAHYYRSVRAARERRRMSHAYEKTVRHLTQRVEALFPTDTRLSQPRGGFVLWVELDPSTNTTEVADQVLAAGISIAPGALFATGDRYDHCLRLNSAQRWGRTTENALVKLAHIIRS